MSRKHTRKFLRMRAYLSHVMSAEAAWKFRQRIEDWRDCQALIACGFKIVGTTAAGTIFEVTPMFSSVVKDDAERSLCLRK